MWINLFDLCLPYIQRLNFASIGVATHNIVLSYSKTLAIGICKDKVLINLMLRNLLGLTNVLTERYILVERIVLSVYLI
jgi:hypothetical protein